MRPTMESGMAEETFSCLRRGLDTEVASSQPFAKFRKRRSGPEKHNIKRKPLQYGGLAPLSRPGTAMVQVTPIHYGNSTTPPCPQAVTNAASLHISTIFSCGQGLDDGKTRKEPIQR